MRTALAIVLVALGVVGAVMLTKHAKRSLTQPYPEDEGSLFV